MLRDLPELSRASMRQAQISVFEVRRLRLVHERFVAQCWRYRDKWKGATTTSYTNAGCVMSCDSRATSQCLRLFGQLIRCACVESISRDTRATRLASHAHDCDDSVLIRPTADRASEACPKHTTLQTYSVSRNVSNVPASGIPEFEPVH